MGTGASASAGLTAMVKKMDDVELKLVMDSLRVMSCGCFWGVSLVGLIFSSMVFLEVSSFFSGFSWMF